MSKVRLDYDTGSSAWRERIALGLVPGAFLINKFFENPSVPLINDPANAVDLWDQGGTKTYTADGLATVDTISSSSANDDMMIAVYGLDENLVPTPNPLNPDEPQYVTLNGQNKVSLSTPVNTIWRLQNVSGRPDITGSGTAKSIEGTVYTYRDTDITTGVPDDASFIEAVIVDGNNQTLMCQFVVPKGYTAIFADAYLAITKKQNTNAAIKWCSRPYGSVSLNQNTGTLDSDANSFTYLSGYVSVVRERTRINVRVTENTTADVGIGGGYKIYLLDNNYLV